jgi:hypothetical protein
MTQVSPHETNGDDHHHDAVSALAEHVAQLIDEHRIKLQSTLTDGKAARAAAAVKGPPPPIGS